MTSNYAKAVLSVNLNSALQQPMAIFNALPELGIQTLGINKSVLNMRRVKPNLTQPKPTQTELTNSELTQSELMQKYSPLYWFRSQGNNTPEMTEITRNQKWEKKVPFLMEWLEVADDWGMKRMWNGAENWVKAHDKSLQEGSPEFYEAVGEKFDEVLYNSQSNSTTLQKAAIMRSDNSLTKAVTLFQNQFYTTYNQILTAAGDVRYAFKTGKGKKEALEKAGLTAAGVILSSLASALISSLRDEWLYGNEAGLPESLPSEALENLAAIMPGGTLAYGFVSSLATGEDWDKDFNGLQVSSINMVNAFIDNTFTLGTAFGKVAGQGTLNGREFKKQLLAPTKKVALNVAQLFGIPFNNAEKLITGFVGSTLDFMVQKEVFPESAAGFREGYQNIFDEYTKSDLKYDVKRKTPLAYQSEFSIVLDNTLNKGSLTNKTKFDAKTKKEIFRLYDTAKDFGVVPTSEIKDFGGVELTLLQQIDAGQKYASVIQPMLDKLFESELYKNFSDKDKIRAIEMAYTYAKNIAGKSVVPEYEQQKWVANVESISDILPVETAIAWRNELNKKGTDGKDFYTNEEKRRLLLEDDNLTVEQKQQLDGKLISDIVIMPKDISADYTDSAEFELSLLSNSKRKIYEEYNLDGKISKEKYALAANALSAAKIESVKDKKGETIKNSASLLMRELIDGLEDLTDKEKKAIYQAMGINKSVAEMGALVFKYELKKIKKSSE